MSALRLPPPPLGAEPELVVRPISATSHLGERSVRPVSASSLLGERSPIQEQALLRRAATPDGRIKDVGSPTGNIPQPTDSHPAQCVANYLDNLWNDDENPSSRPTIGQELVQARLWGLQQDMEDGQSRYMQRMLSCLQALKEEMAQQHAAQASELQLENERLRGSLRMALSTGLPQPGDGSGGTGDAPHSIRKVSPFEAPPTGFLAYNQARPTTPGMPSSTGLRPANRLLPPASCHIQPPPPASERPLDLWAHRENSKDSEFEAEERRLEESLSRTRSRARKLGRRGRTDRGVTSVSSTRERMQRKATIDSMASEIEADEPDEETGSKNEDAEEGAAAAELEDIGAFKRTKKSSIFPDKADMVAKVTEALAKPTYDVKNYYYEKGICQRIARSQTFEGVTLTIIGVNAIWLAIDMDYGSNGTGLKFNPWVFIIADNFFCAFFAFEWGVRLFAFSKKMMAMQDSWFVFDTFLAWAMILETWVTPIVLWQFASVLTEDESDSDGGNQNALRLIRLLRIFRTARMARLLRKMPELMIMIKGIVAASRSVFFTLCLLGIIIYVFALAFRQVTEGMSVGDKYFRTVPMAMSSLFILGTIPDMQQIVEDLGAAHVLLGLFVLLFILVATLTVMNMLVGVLVEVVQCVANIEREQLAASYVGNSLKSCIEKFRHDDRKEQKKKGLFANTKFYTTGSMNFDALNLDVSQDEFEGLLVDKEAARVMQDVGVDVVGLVDLSDMLFRDQDILPFGDLLKLVLQLRGTNQATVKDVVDMRKFFVAELFSVEECLQERLRVLQATCTHISQTVDSTFGFGRKKKRITNEESEYASAQNVQSTNRPDQGINFVAWNAVPGSIPEAL
eukprot:TRINITY_DN7712_c0_g1_i1.p1 TRINITY_DN7712_c0_g1~~TRINITY_DN7712_c0_g1_i1.p1  ORF type:complete len:853 (+),score=238.10 TRINITY_DN7712_c0_g1_i1:82-2640(+)